MLKNLPRNPFNICTESVTINTHFLNHLFLVRSYLEGKNQEGLNLWKKHKTMSSLNTIKWLITCDFLIPVYTFPYFSGWNKKWPWLSKS